MTVRLVVRSPIGTRRSYDALLSYWAYGQITAVRAVLRLHHGQFHGAVGRLVRVPV